MMIFPLKNAQPWSHLPVRRFGIFVHIFVPDFRGLSLPIGNSVAGIWHDGLVLALTRAAKVVAEMKAQIKDLSVGPKTSVRMDCCATAGLAEPDEVWRGLVRSGEVWRGLAKPDEVW